MSSHQPGSQAAQQASRFFVCNAQGCEPSTIHPLDFASTHFITFDEMIKAGSTVENIIPDFLAMSQRRLDMASPQHGAENYWSESPESRAEKLVGRTEGWKWATETPALFYGQPIGVKDTSKGCWKLYLTQDPVSGAPSAVLHHHSTPSHSTGIHVPPSKVFILDLNHHDRSSWSTQSNLAPRSLPHGNNMLYQLATNGHNKEADTPNSKKNHSQPDQSSGAPCIVRGDTARTSTATGKRPITADEAVRAFKLMDLKKTYRKGELQLLTTSKAIKELGIPESDFFPFLANLSVSILGKTAPDIGASVIQKVQDWTSGTRNRERPSLFGPDSQWDLSLHNPVILDPKYLTTVLQENDLDQARKGHFDSKWDQLVFDYNLKKSAGVTSASQGSANSTPGYLTRIVMKLEGPEETDRVWKTFRDARDRYLETADPERE